MASSPLILGIVQARMNSDRLPGKVMMPILELPIVALHVARLKRSRRLSRVVVATTDTPADDILVDNLHSRGIEVFRGSESDVLDRFARCASHYKLEFVVRTTADCPLVDAGYVDRMIDFYLTSEGSPRHGSISLQRVPRGFDAEIFTAEALREASLQATDRYDREHVTPYLYRNVAPGASIQYFPEITAGDLRLCVDEPNDYEMVLQLASRYDGDLLEADLDSIVRFLRANPDIVAINAGVKQRQS